MPGDQDFKAAAGAYTSGVTLVTVRDGRDDVGSTVTAFCSVSLDPPLVAVALAADGYLAELLARCDGFAVTVLSAGQKALAGRFASAGRPSARILLAEVPHHRGPATDALIPDGGRAAIECTPHQTIEAGDHTLFLANAVAVDYVDGHRAPLLHTDGRYR